MCKCSLANTILLCYCQAVLIEELAQFRMLHSILPSTPLELSCCTSFRYLSVHTTIGSLFSHTHTRRRYIVYPV
ncbi:hypothetical protein DFH27DRAFT_544935, partial [Peziza echinospora]